MLTIDTIDKLDDVALDILDYFYNKESQILSYYLKSDFNNKKRVRLSKQGFNLLEQKLKEM